MENAIIIFHVEGGEPIPLLEGPNTEGV